VYKLIINNISMFSCVVANCFSHTGRLKYSEVASARFGVQTLLGESWRQFFYFLLYFRNVQSGWCQIRTRSSVIAETARVTYLLSASLAYRHTASVRYARWVFIATQLNST